MVTFLSKFSFGAADGGKAPSSTRSMAAVEFRNVHKRFGSRVVLDGANLAIAHGTTQVVLGQSGTGKSVLLKCLLGMLPPDRGEIFVDGQPVVGMREKEQRGLMSHVGMLFQSGALFDSMSVWENVAFVQRNVLGMDDTPARRLALEKLDMVGLRPEVAAQNPSELSGGMRKRVALARAIANDPALILYDEPTTGLDPVTSDVISDLIRKLQRELKCTSIVITHDMPCAFKVADRMAFLYQGQFIAEGTLKEFTETQNPQLRQFIDGKADGPIQING